MGSLLLSKAIALNPLSVLVIQSSSIQKQKCRREIVDFLSLNRCFVKGPNLWQKRYNNFLNILWVFLLEYIFFSHKWWPIQIEIVWKVLPNRKKSSWSPNIQTFINFHGRETSLRHNDHMYFLKEIYFLLL